MGSLRIFLFDEPREPLLRLDEIGEYLAETFPFAEIALESDFMSFSDEETLNNSAKKLALARAHLVDNGVTEPMPMETRTEAEWLVSPETKWRGMPYDADALWENLREMTSKEILGLSSLPIIFTSRLITSFDDGGDKRRHARVGYNSQPSIISTTGAREAPAKPREWYLIRQQENITQREGLAETIVPRESYLGYDDDRLTDVLKGYAAQAVFYRLTGDPFCQEKKCRLFNAHWQEEMLNAQLNGKICDNHASFFRHNGQTYSGKGAS